MDIDAIWRNTGESDIDGRRGSLKRHADQCRRCGAVLTEAEVSGDEQHKCSSTTRGPS